MSDIKIGQKVHNCRTGGEGIVIDFVERWTGRHTTRKLQVKDSYGDVKEWSFSTCKVVEDEAPRALVLLKDLLTRAKKHNCLIEEDIARKFNNPEGLTTLPTRCTVYLNDLKNAETFRSLSMSMFGLVITFICLERNIDRISESFAGGTEHFINDLINIYGDRKVK